jgi:hypothetical protein
LGSKGEERVVRSNSAVERRVGEEESGEEPPVVVVAKERVPTLQIEMDQGLFITQLLTRRLVLHLPIFHSIHDLQLKVIQRAATGSRHLQQTPLF